MNKIISIIMLVIMLVSGLESYHLFRLFDYNASALLTITAYLSVVASIYSYTMRPGKPVFE
jgi:hypothetical protein